MIGAEVVADPAAAAILLVNLRADWVDGYLATRYHREHPPGGGAGLGHGVGNVFGALGATGDVDAVGGGGEGIQLGMLLQQEAVGTAGEAEAPGQVFRGAPGLDGVA